MTIDEYIEVMADNADLFPEFAGLSQQEQENIANMNILTGPTEAFRDDKGKLLGVGGMRIVGVAEAWLITLREIRSHPDFHIRRQKFAEFLRITQTTMKRLCDEHDLWRVYAEGKLSTTFLERLGFERTEKALVWTRTE